MRRSVLSSPSLAMGVVVMLVVVMGWGSGKVEGTSFPFEIPEIVIDLDASPEARWEAAVERVLAKHGFDDSFGSIVAFWDETLPSVLGDVVQDVASSLESYIPQGTSHVCVYMCVCVCVCLCVCVCVCVCVLMSGMHTGTGVSTQD